MLIPMVASHDIHISPAGHIERDFHVGRKELCLPQCLCFARESSDEDTDGLASPRSSESGAKCSGHQAVAVGRVSVSPSPAVL